MPGRYKVEPIVIHTYVTPEERAAAVRELTLLGLRMLIAAIPIVWFELWPMREWLELVWGRPVPTRVPAFLVGFTLMLPAMLLGLALRTAWSSSTRGIRYTLDDAAVRWSDTFRHWKFVRAYRIERDRRDRPERLTILLEPGRARAIRLPIDDDALVDRVIAFVDARVPDYDEATHGPLDSSDALPGRTTVALVAASLAGLVLLAMHGRVERHDAKLTLRLIVAGSAIVPFVWYVVVRRKLNVAQRGRAAGYAIAAGMTLLLAGLCVVCAPQARAVVRELRAIPADVRERVGKTISTKQHDSD